MILKTPSSESQLALTGLLLAIGAHLSLILFTLVCFRDVWASEAIKVSGVDFCIFYMSLIGTSVPALVCFVSLAQKRNIWLSLLGLLLSLMVYPVGYYIVDILAAIMHFNIIG